MSKIDPPLLFKNNTNKYGIIFSVMILCLSFFTPTQSKANVTPSHVYQKASELENELIQFYKSEFLDLPNEISGKKYKRLPRHVMQHARVVFDKIQMLRFINGLTKSKLGSPPVREIEPKEVIAMVEQTLAAARDLRPIYGIEQTAIAPAMEEGKTPTDVYGKLARVSQLVDGLGVPPTLPNDVFRTARALVGDIEAVAIALGHTPPPRPASAAGGDKTPTDVYRSGERLLASLAALGEIDEKAAVKGGVTAPPPPKGKITPANVLGLLSNILAELSSLKVVVGADRPTLFPEEVSGRTPSDVYKEIEYAAVVLKLCALGLESGLSGEASVYE